ncbi:DUF4124 domain-containing protein [Pseudoalteromonas prydzensis]|uniref:DUF4124 domain-containing protein n=1 Tax=Pseudoalteromonas prydzensis TaxID=182141 RepID=UPI0024BC3FAA|nr:DUF4124 domain-containing protein [Pseudoalteromonas prydzensis]
MNKHQSNIRTLKIILPCVITLCFVAPLHASVYQCEKNGVMEFSQFPCGNDAKLITVKEQNPAVPSNIVTHGDMDSTEVDTYIRTKQIDADIQQHQDKIDTLSEKMNQEIADLKDQSDAQLNNLSGAEKETAIANQMTNVSERYNVLIEREQRDIDRLQQEKLGLPKVTNSSEIDKQSTQSKDIDSFIRVQEIKRDIEQRQSKIDTYQAQMDKQIAALETQASEQPNNLTDATFDNSLSRKMTALTSKYATLIDVEQRQIDRLLQELATLQ